MGEEALKRLERWTSDTLGGGITPAQVDAPEPGSYYRVLGLIKNPFEAQGEFDPDVSLEVTPFRTEELRHAREIIRMSAHDRKLIVAIVVGEPATGKTYLVKKLSKGEAHSKECKHIYLKLGIGASADHLYILGLIVSKLKEEVDRLEPPEVRRYLDSLEDVIRNPVTIEGALGQVTLQATRLLNDWYAYVAALRDVGGYRSVALYLDEVEDRWGIKGVPGLQREEDLIYLRDLIGFVQDEKDIAGKFPVAMFLCMTAETYGQIGSDNNALQTRLQRPIHLRRFTPEEAKLLVKEKLKAFRTSTSADFYPYTEDAIDFLLKKATMPNFFNFRKFLIDCHDSLYSFAEQMSTGRDGPEILDHKGIVEWYDRKGGSVEVRVPEGAEYVEGLQLIDVKISKEQDAQRTWQRLRKELAGDTRKQYRRALDAVRSVLVYASPEQFAFGPGVADLIVKIPDARAQVPVKIRDAKDGRESNGDGFILYVSDEKSPLELQSSETLLVLPREHLPLFAIFPIEGLLPDPEKERAVRVIGDEISQAIARIHAFFEENRKAHYLPHNVPSSPKKVEGLADELGRFLELGDKSGVSKTRLMELDVSNGVTLKDPYWMPLLRGHTPDSAEDLRDKMFFFNLDASPVRGALSLLETLGATNEGVFVGLDDVKKALASQCEQWEKAVRAKYAQIERDLGGSSPATIRSLVDTSSARLTDIRNQVLEYKRRADSSIENFVALYNSRTKAASTWSSASERLEGIAASAKKFAVIRANLEALEESLKKQRFNHDPLKSPIKDLRKRLNTRLQGDWEAGEGEFDNAYSSLQTEAQSFLTKSKSIEDRIQDLKATDLEKAEKRGFLGSGVTLEPDWSKLITTSNLGEAEILLRTLEGQQNLLREKASEHLKGLQQRQANAQKIVAQLERYVGREKMGQASDFAGSIAKRLGEAMDYFAHGDYAEVLAVDIGTEYLQIRPAIRSLFTDKEFYTLKEVGHKFSITEAEAADFVRTLEKNGILVAYYRASAEDNE